uniref:Uncharacterized protein n=1 Tax=Colletotrichum fructicola (strain Nara gc5) TaxID=1213859 RepID=L2FAM2_COLFN
MDTCLGVVCLACGLVTRLIDLRELGGLCILHPRTTRGPLQLGCFDQTFHTDDDPIRIGWQVGTVETRSNWEGFLKSRSVFIGSSPTSKVLHGGEVLSKVQKHYLLGSYVGHEDRGALKCEDENPEDSGSSIFAWAMHVSAQRLLPHNIPIVLWRNIMTSLLGAAWELLLPSDHLGHLPPDPNEPAENSERMCENLLKSNRRQEQRFAKHEADHLHASKISFAEFLLRHRCRGSHFHNPVRAQRNALDETASAMFDLNEEMVSNAKDIQTGRDNVERVHESLLRLVDKMMEPMDRIDRLVQALPGAS